MQFEQMYASLKSLSGNEIKFEIISYLYFNLTFL